MFRLGYNTNGLAHHRPADALRLLADLGYRGVAITPDVGALDPLSYDLRVAERLGALADDLDLVLDLETGARFLLDPRKKHEPTLLADDDGARWRRVEFLLRSLNLAQALGARTMSMWSGAAPCGTLGDPESATGSTDEARLDELWTRLADGVRTVLDLGREVGVRVGFEPEPGMFVERPSGFAQLLERLGRDGGDLGLTLDVGHCVCTGDVPIEQVVATWSERLVAVQLADMRPGEHVHRMFGEGELDLVAVMRALASAGFTGLAAVELSRDSVRGPQVAERAFGHLERAVAAAGVTIET